MNKAANKAEAEQQVSEYILFYNQNRFQKKIKDRSPGEYRETAVSVFLELST
nr:IS3 family transposase [Paenibacillus illinoisensis]